MRKLQLLPALALLLAACGSSTPTGPSDPGGGGDLAFSWSGQIAAGQTLEVIGVIGFIRGRAASGSISSVSSTRSGVSSDPAEVDIQVVEHAGGVTICAVYPAPPGEPPNRCVPGGSAQQVENNDVAVAWEVSVAPGVMLDGKTVIGDISAQGMQGDVLAHSVDGDIGITTSGVATASTTNGLIDVALAASDFGRDLEFTSVNGNVTVEIPASASAIARLSTVNGTVSSEFPLSQTGPRTLAGIIGTGGDRLTMTTVNGDVRLERNP